MRATGEFADLDDIAQAVRPPGPFAAAAAAYLEAGWSPVPCDAKRLLVTGVSGYLGRVVTTTDVTRWSREFPDANVALRLPKDMVAIDVDHYDGKPGADTLAELVERCGPLPPTVVATARDLPSGKFLYRVPAGTRLRVKAGAGIDIVQHHHRYVVCAPSVHHTGAEVRWIDQASGEVLDGVPVPEDVPDLPWAWIDALSVTGSHDVGTAANDAQVARWLERCTSNARPGWLDAVLARVHDEIHGNHHDTMLAALCQVAREAAGGAYPARDAHDRLRAEWVRTTTADRIAEFDGRSAGTPVTGMVQWAVGQCLTESGKQRIAEIKKKLTDEPVGTQVSTGMPVLPDPFWSARPTLGHIRRAARSRLIAPDALLGATLARACSYLDFRVLLPDVSSRYGSLNVNVGLVGWSGAGKGSAIDTADDLLADPKILGHKVRTIPAGSGEGMVKGGFYSSQDVEDDRGQKRKQMVMTHQGVLIRVDEGELFGSLAGRNGQTTMQFIRQAWSGEAIGGAYASDEKNLRPEQHSYRWALVVAVQPELAGPLIEDTAGGTAQRMLWLATVDPTLPDEDEPWPGPVTWRPPRWNTDCTVGSVRGHERGFLEVADEIRSEIRDRRRDRVRGDSTDAGHADLNRLKLAGLLAVLDGRADVNVEDWRLAGMIADTSDKVTDWMRTQMARAQVTKARAGAEITAKRNAVVTNAAAATDRVARLLWKHADTPTSPSKLRKAIRSDDRKHFDAALEFALARGWVVYDDDERLTRSDSEPAEATA